jgi:hypothetical protein
MGQANPVGERPGVTGRWRLVFLCLAIAGLLCFCLLAAIIYSISGFVRNQDDGVAAKNRDDISVLSVAIDNFETTFAVTYLPSRFVLCETISDYKTGMSDPDPVTAQLYTDSFQYLSRVWPRIDFATDQPGPPGWNGIDWNGNSVQDPPVILEGDQCLVFFLGGIQSNKEKKLECLGFSLNGSNPAQAEGDRVGVFYQFKSSRLNARPNGYFVYLDAYGKTPLAYFSGYKVTNGYNRYGTTDCKSIPDGPYHDGDGNYYNPDSFQVISAGADVKFGRGGKWTPAKATEIDPDGRDDMSNFHPTLLGNTR